MSGQSGGEEALPKLISEVQDDEFRTALEQHLSQARDREIRSVERAVLAPGVVEAMVPAAELAGNISERRRGMAEAPDALRRSQSQSAAPANARAAGTTRCRSSGVRARRRTEAGASSSSRVLHPKNQALAVSGP